MTCFICLCSRCKWYFVFVVGWFYFVLASTWLHRSMWGWFSYYPRAKYWDWSALREGLGGLPWSLTSWEREDGGCYQIQQSQVCIFCICLRIYVFAVQRWSKNTRVASSSSSAAVATCDLSSLPTLRSQIHTLCLPHHHYCHHHHHQL